MSEAGYYKYKRALKKPYKYTDLLTTIHTLIKEDPENSNYGVKRIFEALKNYHQFREAIAPSTESVRRTT